MDETSKTTSAAQHWLIQRITAIILIPLTYQLLVFLGLVLNSPRQQTIDWLDLSINKVSLLAWLTVTAYHAALGLQVVLEDYIGDIKLQQILIKITNWGLLALTIIALLMAFNIN